MALVPEDTGLIRSLFEDRGFIDRAMHESAEVQIDVIIPVLHSNNLWKENLLSFYREVPIHRLILGDAGCIDDTVTIARGFPRVEIVDHTKISTLGASIADLTKRVTTTKFAYIQSDVYLPEGWFDAMNEQTNGFDWVGSPMQIVTMLDYELDYTGQRPLAGAQMGNSEMFKRLEDFVDDDFVYRQEDFVLEEFVRRQGGAIGNSKSTYHFHQVMRRNTTGMKMNVQSISINLNESVSERTRVNSSQLQGFLKYCDPRLPEVRNSAFAAYCAQDIGQFRKLRTTLEFVSKHNSLWRKSVYLFAIKAGVTSALIQIRRRAIQILTRVR